MSAMNTLDKDRLQDLIEYLQLASKTGFSSLSSPIEFLLETATDLCLIISSQLKEGMMTRQNNPEIKFSEFQSDDLGNPKQISIRKTSKFIWDPETASFVKKLASFFVLIKKGKILHDSLIESGVSSSLSLRKEQEQKEKKHKKSSSQKNSAYYRRQRNKRRENQ